MLQRSTQRNRQTERDQESDTELGNYKIERTFDPPKTAIVRGRLVKVSSQGNAEGHSPAWEISDQGKPEIVSFDEVTFIDLDMLAPTTDQVVDLLRGLKR